MCIAETFYTSTHIHALPVINQIICIVNYKSINLNGIGLDTCVVHMARHFVERERREARHRWLATITQEFNGSVTLSNTKCVRIVSAARNLTEGWWRREWDCAQHKNDNTQSDAHIVEQLVCRGYTPRGETHCCDNLWCAGIAQITEQMVRELRWGGNSAASSEARDGERARSTWGNDNRGMHRRGRWWAVGQPWSATAGSWPCPVAWKEWSSAPRKKAGQRGGIGRGLAAGRGEQGRPTLWRRRVRLPATQWHGKQGARHGSHRSNGHQDRPSKMEEASA
jgi:hypothetical protein